ncbi:alkaline ceramidase-like protein [Protomyces lactucae-debilis]|uniref:Alkaline ceramidase-like protein n=1 Tax=Protomyces lactucae-debilis TaxID=2754530 RepID=A0A1Y2EPC4_PROLT|nr:alkaline ceramidase-like protein [Protomyces lactucae-debilis]ORY73392.1 alkaline ceramidase-like protein [Protomyces lactucae-debilis]
MARYFSIPYTKTPKRKYFWGPVTASIDWCEENYVVSRYIAEFCNTTTNAIFIILASIAIRNAIRWHYERRILLTSVGFLTVGLGSWLFHMTLKYEFQLLDELPMIWTTLIMFWGIFDYGLSRAYSLLLAAGTTLLGAGVTWYYLVNKNPVFHEFAYGLITAAVLLRSWYLVHKRVDKEDFEARDDLKYSATWGAVTFLTGFALWGIDRGQCSNLTHAKHVIGMPWGFLLELHGWWHLLTGTGVALYIVFLTQLRLHLTGRQDEFEIRYVLRFWPVLERKHERLLRD